MCNETKRRLIGKLGSEDIAKQHKVIFYGDYQHGKSRSLSATSTSWDVIRAEFARWNCEFRIKSNPRILDRVNATNARQRSADGTIRYSHDPSCVELGKDDELVSLEELQGGAEGDRGHACSARDYMINYEYPITGNMSRYL
jgi:hypothetical protein